MASKLYKWIDFFILFVAIPISLMLNYDVRIKLIIGVTGFIYIIYVLLKVEKQRFKINPNLN